MKKDISPLQHYAASPLKVIETDNKDKAQLRGLKREDTLSKQHVYTIANYSINNPGTWDPSWFSNYE